MENRLNIALLLQFYSAKALRRLLGNLEEDTFLDLKVLLETATMNPDLQDRDKQNKPPCIQMKKVWLHRGTFLRAATREALLNA